MSLICAQTSTSVQKYQNRNWQSQLHSWKNDDQQILYLRYHWVETLRNGIVWERWDWLYKVQKGDKTWVGGFKVEGWKFNTNREYVTYEKSWGD